MEWTGTGADNRFEIDLYYCGSMCMEVSLELIVLTRVSAAALPSSGLFWCMLDRNNLCSPLCPMAGAVS